MIFAIGWVLTVIGVLILVFQFVFVRMQINRYYPWDLNIRIWGPGLMALFVGVAMLVRG